MAILFAVVARGTTILAKHAWCGGNFLEVTEQILAKIPSENNKLTYSHGKYSPEVADSIVHYIIIKYPSLSCFFLFKLLPWFLSYNHVLSSQSKISFILVSSVHSVISDSFLLQYHSSKASILSVVSVQSVQLLTLSSGDRSNLVLEISVIVLAENSLVSRNLVKREQFLEEVVSSIKCIRESHWMWSVEIIGGSYVLIYLCPKKRGYVFPSLLLQE
ncbi:hypothetical protein FD755_024930 [Muntiacus reevesi]|uniref:Uncharacterized protein n=1 Tax=Muntiacus reevesi TaxID=9886 RepID=A0A5N3URW7_MUNRE|nr:hypothetical protein FD755_024930 [Muntiacus reevesi]